MHFSPFEEICVIIIWILAILGICVLGWIRSLQVWLRAGFWRKTLVSLPLQLLFTFGKGKNIERHEDEEAVALFATIALMTMVGLPFILKMVIELVILAIEGGPLPIGVLTSIFLGSKNDIDPRLAIALDGFIAPLPFLMSMLWMRLLILEVSKDQKSPLGKKLTRASYDLRVDPKLRAKAEAERDEIEKDLDGYLGPERPASKSRNNSI